MSTKNSNHTIWNRTRDLPVCSEVPQPTAPPRPPYKKGTNIYEKDNSTYDEDMNTYEKGMNMYEKGMNM
jgi:hypothetical protein